MAINWKNPFVKKVIGSVQHYNERSYWKMRDSVINHCGGGTGLLLPLAYKENRCI